MLKGILTAIKHESEALLGKELKKLVTNDDLEIAIDNGYAKVKLQIMGITVIDNSFKL